MDREIEALLEKTARTRYDFLRTELQVCFTAIDMAHFELSLGNTSVAVREVAFVDRGIKTMQRFLPEVSAEQRRELELRLAELKASLVLLNAQLNRPCGWVK